MKLYYAPVACSLAPHIVAREAGLDIDLVKVDIFGDHKTEDGRDYRAINPRGYVPALEFDDGSIHTEAAVLIQFLADQAPSSGLLPASGSIERLVVQEWVSFVATELHKSFSPWLWDKGTAEATRTAVHAKLDRLFHEIDDKLVGQEYLTGNQFTVADAYMFTIVNWTNFLGIDLKQRVSLSAFMARIANRSNVRAALKAEGLLSE
jgi:glutathione S-transferase